MGSSDGWRVAATLSDTASADAIAQLLRLEGVECLVISDSALMGKASSAQVLVPNALAHRARWILAQSQVSEAELDYLATGRLWDDDALR